MEINGIAHIQLTVNDFAQSAKFYDQLLSYLEMLCIYRTDDTLYYIGGRTGIAITQAADEFKQEKFQQRRVGLHHFCFRVKQKEHIDEVYEFVKTTGAKIIRPPTLGKWAEGYYSILLEDPDGIRIEFCFVPGVGNLDPDLKFPLAVSLI